MTEGARPQCSIEVVNPDDILIVGINNKWFRTFTSSSDRYPVVIDVPHVFLNDGWNLVTGTYTNVALVGKNDANLEYRVLLDDAEVVHVVYKTEVQPEHFTVALKDTFSIRAREVDKGRKAGSRRSKRYQDLMAFHKESDEVAAMSGSVDEGWVPPAPGHIPPGAMQSMMAPQQFVPPPLPPGHGHPPPLPPGYGDQGPGYGDPGPGYGDPGPGYGDEPPPPRGRPIRRPRR